MPIATPTIDRAALRTNRAPSTLQARSRSTGSPIGWVERRGFRHLYAGWRWLISRGAALLPDVHKIPLLERLQIARPMDYPLHDIRLGVASRAEWLRLFSVMKEPWTVEWIETHVQPGEVFYDIGANVGAYSLVAAKATQGTARVYAFEPGFANYASLCRNIVINGCQDCITPLPILLGAETQVATFKYRGIAPGLALHATGDRRPGKLGDPAYGQAAYEQPMLAYRLDDLVKHFHLPPPNHIKLDVDGAEMEVLAGAAEILALPTLTSIMVELPKSGEGADAEIRQVLHEQGLELQDRITHESTNAPDYGLFIRSR